MFNLDILDKDTIIRRRARDYVMGMTVAKAEMIQQEIDMAVDTKIGNKQLGESLNYYSEYLESNLRELCSSDGDWVTIIKDLDKVFKFITDPDCLVNTAIRAAAISVCNTILDNCNERIFEPGADPKYIEHLNQIVKDQSQTRTALKYYQSWMNTVKGGNS